MGAVNLTVVTGPNQLKALNRRHFENIKKASKDIITEMANDNLILMKLIASQKKVPPSIIAQMKGSMKDGDLFQNSSEHPASIFFERGVRPHRIFGYMFDSHGRAVKDWLDARGLSYANVGNKGPLKKPGAQFMEASYEETWKNRSEVTDKNLAQVIR